MIVAFDATTAAFEKKTGTGVYCEELIKAYQERFEDWVVHTYRLTRRVKGRNFLLPLSNNSSRETVLDPFHYFRGRHYDVFHGLNSRLPLLKGCKRIATIHDLFSIFGEFADPKFRTNQTRHLTTMLKRCDHVIVPATYTKNLLEEKLKIPPNQISVVSEGVRDIFLKNISKDEAKKFVLDKWGLTDRYLLFVGTLEKRKNIIGLIRSFIRLNQMTKGAPDLVLVGHKGFEYEQIEKEIKSSGLLRKIKWLGFAQSDELPKLFAAAEAFVYLSLEEGFGIPVVEAMASGIPVISSDTTSLPEVGAGLTWLTNPHDHDAIANLLAHVLENTDATKEKIQRAQKYAQAKTWTRVAEDTRAVYEKILKDS